MTQAEPVPVEPDVIDDQFLEIAQDLERGTWIEFEADRRPARVCEARVDQRRCAAPTCSRTGRG